MTEKKLFRFLGVWLLLSLNAVAGQIISAHDDRIQVQGTRYITRTETGLRFQRHREDVLKLPRQTLGLNPDKARNTAGIVLAFRTDSKQLALKFRILSANYMGTAFGVFENGKLSRESQFKPQAEEAVLKFCSNSPGMSLFEIALPSFANVEFQSLEIDDGATLQKMPLPKIKVYVALGDSISHGVGQEGTSHKTWPFLLAHKLNYELFNLAVGGAKVSVPTAEMLADWEHIDLITILVGYNDLHFDGKTPEQYKEKYSQMLDAIRKNHPETPVYCISLLYTRKPKSDKTGATAEDFRSVLAELIRERRQTDPHIFLIEGDKITSAENLRTDRPNDPVHLSVKGAALLADKLSSLIKE